MGPTGVVLVQRGPWTASALANQICSVAGDSNRAEVNQTFIQPYLSQTTPEAWTFSLQAEVTHDWKSSEWLGAVTGAVSRLVRFGDLPVSLAGGVRIWAESATSGPRDWGARFTATFLLPWQ